MIRRKHVLIVAAFGLCAGLPFGGADRDLGNNSDGNAGSRSDGFAWAQVTPPPKYLLPTTQPADDQPTATQPPASGEPTGSQPPAAPTSQPAAAGTPTNQPATPATPTNPSAAPATPTNPSAVAGAPASQPASAATDSTTGDPQPRREPSPTEILRELSKVGSKTAAPVTRPVQPGQTTRTLAAEEALPPNAVAAPAAKLLPDGYRLVDRPGRLARQEDFWVFSFEDRGQGAPELPIRLLPNRMLEDMEDMSAGGTRPIVFIVSGEVTEYRGLNYLLIEKLLTRPDLGNLK